MLQYAYTWASFTDDNGFMFNYLCKYPAYLPLLLALFLTVGCAENVAYRTHEVSTACPASGCPNSVLEKHSDYDIGFVEFTDRGNVFDREHMNAVLRHVASQAASPKGAAVVVFIHGWKHNAAPADRNLQSFRKMLEDAARIKVNGERRLIGIYVGWRGQTFKMPVAENLTYWARKNTAHDVGKGGVTELLLRLERELSTQNTATEPNHNVFVTLGHSFGGSVLLSAMNDVLLDRAIRTHAVGLQFCRSGCQRCVQTEPFGHGIILLNPAVEANEILQLKEVVAEEQCYAKTQPKLLHVLSSQADIATSIAFRAGQYLGVSIGSSEVPLERVYKGKKVTLHEHELDTNTIGNYLPFRSGLSVKQDGNNSKACKTQDKGRRECYISYEGDKEKLLPEQLQKHHIPANSDEPLHFLYTDADFVKDHNDVFNARVAAYIVAVVKEAGFQRMSNISGGLNAVNLADIDTNCAGKTGGGFSFSNCFDHYTREFEAQKK
jgi:hypothetical protein